MKKYSGNNKPYTYVSFPAKKKEQALSILEKLTASDEGKKLNFWYDEGENLTKKEKKRIEAACSLLIFADRESLGDERFKQTVDAAVSSDKSVLCVHLEPFEYETSWAKMQLGPQQAIISKGSDADASITKQLKSAEIFKDLRVTKTQKQRKRRQMTSLIATPVALALVVLGVLFATGVLPPKNDEGEVTVEDTEQIIYIPDSDISGTAEELAKIKTLVLVGGYSYTEDYEGFYCTPVINDGYWDTNWRTFDYNRYSHIDFCYNGGTRYTAPRGNISDISFLEYMPNLETLIIAGNRVSDISPVFRLEKLKHLHLQCNNITSIEGISALKKLEDINIGFNPLTDTSDLFECPSLGSFNLEASRLTELGTDDLSGFYWADLAYTDISYIPKMGVGMEFIGCDLQDTKVTDYSFLGKAKSYSILITDGPVKDTLIPAIKGKEINELYWQHSDIGSLEELDGIRFADDSMGVLELVLCDITDLHGVENIKGLKTLGLFSDFKLKNLNGLEKSETLEIVGVYITMADRARELSQKTGIKYVVTDYDKTGVQEINYDDARGSWEPEYEHLNGYSDESNVLG